MHVATICGISERTVFQYERKWREEGEFSERKVGSGARWLLDDEEMRLAARKWCWEREREGFIANDFLCKFLQKQECTKTLRNAATAHAYLSKLGYHFRIARKGKYIDGHEREDVVAGHGVFCAQIQELLQEDVVFIAQDESIYHAKDRFFILFSFFSLFHLFFLQ